MKRTTFITLFAILAFAAIPAYAQFGNIEKAIKDKTENTREPNNSSKTEKEEISRNKEHSMYNEKDPFFIFIGKDELSGKPINGFSVCAGSYGLNTFPLKKRFEKWITDISPTAQEKSYASGTCDLMGFTAKDETAREQEKLVESLETRAQGDSAYKIEGNSLILVKDYVIPENYVVVVPDVDKPGLALKDLNLGVTPALKNTYRRKAKGVYNYHDLEQALYLFEKYRKYPGANQTNSVLFSGADFETLNKQGKFKGLKIYRLVGEKLVPLK